MGHLVRCLSLAETLGETADCEIRFAIRWDPSAEKYLSRSKWRNGEGVEFVDDENEIRSFHEIVRKLGPKAVVLDIPLAGRVVEYLAPLAPDILRVSLHEHNYSILAGDIVIAPTVRPVAIAPGATAGVTHYRGAEYVILSPEIEKMRNRVKPPGRVVEKGFISLGGADPGYLTLEILAAVSRLSADASRITWNVVLGPLSGYEAERLRVEYPDFIRFHNGSEMSRREFLELLGMSDIAITNAGTTLCEALALGRPTVAVPQNDFEADVACIMGEAGACLVSRGNSRLTRKELGSIISGGDRRIQMAEKGKATLDGLGAHRVAHLILSRLG
jgi:spore coat polysaccharide biosynthesis predicted glycosyltransferase SpsG